MKNGPLSLPAAALAFLVLAAVAAAQDVPSSHRDLNWQAPNLWVHVDNLDAGQAPVFESARLGWLQVLRQGRAEEPLGDGRALFWQARTSPAGQTFFSFYPFAAWTDFEGRREMVTRTQALVGQPAVTAYDAGDVALVSPHYSQVWRRASDFDITSEATAGLTELTAAVGRIEIHDIDITRWDEYEQRWRQLTGCLRAQGYPLACRSFRSSFGRGEYQVWWLAPDAATYRAAPSLASVLELQMGADAAAELLATLAAVFPLREAYEVERRSDLCNLGR